MNLTKIWMYVGGALAAIWGLLLVVSRLKKAGRDEAKVEQAIATDKKRQEMQDANAAGPRTADDVDQRLRDGKF